MTESSNEDILDTINMSDDLESQTTVRSEKLLENQNSGILPLKSILKKQSSFASENDNLILIKAVSFCASALIIIICIPLIFCDLYYGFTDKSCINEVPNGLNFTMKIYLLVSGFTGLLAMLISICIICSLQKYINNKQTLICIRYLGLIGGLFHIFWNILGAATFWGTIYKRGDCESIISTYIYISLIIKFIGNLSSINQILKNSK
jgi:uncharacterized membrane protein